MRRSLKVKRALSARSGSPILKNPSDPYYSLVKKFQDVVCHNPPSVLPPDKGVRHKIDSVPGLYTALHGCVLYQRNNVTSLKSF